MADQKSVFIHYLTRFVSELWPGDNFESSMDLNVFGLWEELE